MCFLPHLTERKEWSSNELRGIEASHTSLQLIRQAFYACREVWHHAWCSTSIGVETGGVSWTLAPRLQPRAPCQDLAGPVAKSPGQILPLRSEIRLLILQYMSSEHLDDVALHSSATSRGGGVQRHRAWTTSCHSQSRRIGLVCCRNALLI